MPKLLKYIPTLMLVFPLYADVHNGEELFTDASCLQCHDTDTFTKPQRKAKDLKSLHERVSQCEFSTNTGWFDDEVTDVVEYLNRDFYKFKSQK